MMLPIRSRARAESAAQRRWHDADCRWDDLIYRRDDTVHRRDDLVRCRDDAGQPSGLSATQAAMVAYFAGQRVEFDVSLDLTGLTDFRRKVLSACAKIPYGATITYGELADRVGSPGAARAVGGVMANNPVPLIVPCHRVLAASGKMGGFSAQGGVAVKARMLRLEGVV